MRAEIVSIGTELLLGTITDTNASYLAQRLAALGIDCFYVSQVGDNLGRLTDTLRRAWERSDLTVTTGGLGPTGDDLTREAIAEMLGETPTVVPALEAALRAFFERRRMAMPERNLKQATLIPSASTLHNPVGTAPGWWVERSEETGRRRIIVSMPGVPFEMKRMWEQEVEPRLRPLSQSVLVSRTLKVLGMGESHVEEMLTDLMSGANPTLAPYAKSDGIHLRISAKAPDEESARRLISGLETQVRQRLGSAVYGADEDTPLSVARGLLRRAGLSYALLEVGEGAAGSVAPLLDGSEPALGVFTARDLPAMAHLLGVVDGDITLEGLAGALRSKLGANVVLAVSVSQAPVEEDAGAVLADIDLCLIGPGTDDKLGGRGLGVHHSWRTAPGEVPRLGGLVALNLLRQRLLSAQARNEQ